MPRYDAVGFDLLTALLDTLPLWRSAAGDDLVGTRWHTANQRLLRGTPYRPFDELVHESAKEVGLGRAHATTLLSRWGEAQPWPDTRRALIALGDLPRFIVTNCSQKLGERAAKQAGEFSFVMTAEQAGAYKPDPRPYRAALAAIGLEAKRVLFVAGSAHDVGGAKRVGLDVYWANRHQVSPPDDAAPLVHATDLGKLAALVDG
ncbi:MAG TPA: HAD-IA family hydrolase [Candidatus Limnocylindria bacterium]|nr:HAD-IA family hydrolase [Candidatus Limnocylindria bacterium]